MSVEVRCDVCGTGMTGGARRHRTRTKTIRVGPENAVRILAVTISTLPHDICNQCVADALGAVGSPQEATE